MLGCAETTVLYWMCIIWLFTLADVHLTPFWDSSTHRGFQWESRNAGWCLSTHHVMFFQLPVNNSRCVHVVHLFLWQDWVKMAEGSRDQGGVGTADPEDDSPNMIVYRKARLDLCVCYNIWAVCWEKHSLRGNDPWTGSWQPTGPYQCASTTHWFLCQRCQEPLFQPSWNKLNSVSLRPSLQDPISVSITSLANFSPPMF